MSFSLDGQGVSDIAKFNWASQESYPGIHRAFSRDCEGLHDILHYF